MQLNTVVLPAPFGPITAVISRSRAAKESVVDGDQAAEAHGQVLDREDRRRSHAALRVGSTAARRGLGFAAT